MTSFNLYEAYAAVYDEDLREEILTVEEDFSFIDELSDNELDLVMEEIIVEENLNINECFEMFDDLLIEARVTSSEDRPESGRSRVTSSKAEAEARKQAVVAAKERVAARKQARKSKEKEERSQRRAERVERIKGSISRVAKTIGKKLTVGAEKAKRALQGRDSGSERKVRQAKIKMRDVARKGIRKAVTGERGQTRPPAVTTGKTEKASSGDYTPPSKKTVGKEVKDAAKSTIRDTTHRGGGVGRRETASSGGIQSRTRYGGGDGPSSTGRALPPKGAGTRTAAGNPRAESQRTLAMSRAKSQGKKALAKLNREEFELLASYILEDLISEGYAETFEEALNVLESFSDYEVGEIAENYLVEETVDLYDVVLEHLLDEGYADTNENALAIMANMSEEWREEILDEAVRGSGRSIGDRITGNDIRGVTRGNKSVYKKPKWKDDVENKVDREVQLLSDRKKKKKSEMDAGRLTVATKRGIEKATNRSNDGPGGDEFAPGSAVRRREEDDQPTDYRARRRRASGR